MRGFGIAIAALMVVVSGRESRAAIVTLDAVNSGWYTTFSISNGTRNNIYTSGRAGDSYHNWLGFDLSSVAGTILSATLEVVSDGRNTSGSIVTWHDVTTPYDLLGTHFTPYAPEGAAVYDDLGDGEVFASGIHTAGTINSFVLNSAGISALNAAGGLWAVGGSTDADTGAFGFNSGVGSGDHIRLLLEISENAVVPEPTSMALAGFAGISMAVGAWRRRQQAA